MINQENNTKDKFNEEDKFIECEICLNFFSYSNIVICELCNFFFCLEHYSSHFNIYHEENNSYQHYNTDYIENDNNNIIKLENDKNFKISNENKEINLNNKIFNDKIEFKNLNQIKNTENLNQSINNENLITIKKEENLNNNNENDNNFIDIENINYLDNVDKNNINKIENIDNLNINENININYQLDSIENKNDIKNIVNLNQKENKILNQNENINYLNLIEIENNDIKYYEDLFKINFNTNIYNSKYLTEYSDYLKENKRDYPIKKGEDLIKYKLNFCIFIINKYSEYFKKNENKENVNYLYNNNDDIENIFNYNIIKNDFQLYINNSNEYLILNSKEDVLNICETCGFQCYLYLKYERFSIFSYFNLFLIKKCKFKHIKKIDLNLGLELDLKCEKCKIINSNTNYYFIIKTKKYFCQKCFFKENLSFLKLKKNDYLDISISKKYFEEKLENAKNNYNKSLNSFEKLTNIFLNLIENKFIDKDFNLIYRELNLFKRKNKNLLNLSKILIEKYEYYLNNNCLTKEINESFKNIINFNIIKDFSKFTEDKLSNSKYIIEQLLSNDNLILKIPNNIIDNENIKILDLSFAYLTFVKILKNGNLIVSWIKDKKIYIQLFYYPLFYKSIERLINDASTSFSNKIINIFELSNNNFILQTKNNYLYFLNESQLLTDETLPHIYVENLIHIFPINNNTFYTIVKYMEVYFLNKYINMNIISTFQLQIPFNFYDAFYFKNYDIIFFYKIKKIYVEKRTKFLVSIGNFNIKNNLINFRQFKYSFAKKFIKLKNNMILLQSFFITIFNVKTLQEISIIEIANEYIDLKYLNYNTILAVDKKNNFIHIDSLMTMKEIGIQKNYFNFYNFHILKNGILYVKSDNILEFNFEFFE